MNNNDILRGLRYAMDSSDVSVIRMIAEGGETISRDELAAILKKEEDAGFLACSQAVLEAFLDGLITEKRGKMEPRPDQPTPEPSRFSNNGVLKKIRIAFELKEDDILAIMDLAGFRVSRPEISALFRKEGHKNYRPCGDQLLRNFLKGLALRLRAAKS